MMSYGDLKRCGGYRWGNLHYLEGRRFLSPLVLECATCGKRADLFDADAHGYDAEMGLVGRPNREGIHAVYECPDCGRQLFETFAGIEYSPRLYEDDSPEFGGRKYDLFSWFTLVVKCCRFARSLTVADFEGA